jgi:ribonuclease D
MTPQYIDQPAALASLCRDLHGQPWLALDTEFIREKTYYPQLCLVQVATPALVACIDPLALDLQPLLDRLYDPTMIKVLHAAHQDLEIFYQLRGAVPGPVFDTQLAATLLGQGEQVGYATLVHALLGVELDKSQTRTDWSRRPLAAAQLTYAAADVSYLAQVYQHQRAELERRQRLDWLADDFAALSDPTRYCTPPEQAWQRIKGHTQLRGVQLAVLRALASWREQQARSLNRPRRWLLGDEVLLDLARQPPTDWGQLQPLRGLEGGFLKRHAQTLLTLITEARNEPADRWPHAVQRRALPPLQEPLLDAVQALIQLRGLEQAVSPALLASRNDLERLLQGVEEVPLLRGWRAVVAGHEVQALLRGELWLAVQDGHLCTVSPLSPNPAPASGRRE